MGIPPDPDAYTVFVASLTLERVWNRLFEGHEDMAPASQRAGGSVNEGENPFRFLFDHALRLFVSDRSILSKSDERVLLQRAMEDMAEDPEMARVLRKDVLAWRDALALAASEGLDLTESIPDPFADRLVNPRVGMLLRALQARFMALQREKDRYAYERVAREYLQDRYTPTPFVIFEGFTHFDALQRLCLDASISRGSTVFLLHAYRSEQAYGFAVMDRVYAPFLAPGRRSIDTSITTVGVELLHLQTHLFADKSADAPSGDGSVTLEAYGHRHQEIAACIRRIQDELRGGVKTHEIAVVMRDSYEFQALLQEEAELQHLADAEGHPVTLSIQPRFLLLTPLGRFTLALYEAWREGELRLEPDGFEAMLASGWLGAHVQATTDQFTAVRGQIFQRCRSRVEWDAALDRLRRLRGRLAAGSRLPAAAVTEDALSHWGAAVGLVEALCRRLFTGPQRSIGGHIQALLDELSRLNPELMRAKEREVLDRIREALVQVAAASSLPMTAEEFSEILTGLVHESERRESEGEAERPNQVWCITPPGVDGYKKEIIYYLGVDDRRVPRRYADPWPFFASDIAAHQETERHLFLAVARAARRRLHLSYAQVDEGGAYRASLYLEEAAAVLGRTISSVHDTLAPAPGDAAAPARPAAPARRDRYSLAEVAHFGLCPFRYKLETLDGAARAYRDATDAFQLVPLAQATWLDLVFGALEGSSRTADGTAAARALLESALEETRTAVTDAFPGLRELHWNTVERYVRGDLSRVSDAVGTYAFRAIPGETPSYAVPDGDRVVQIDAPVRHAYFKGDYRYPFLGDLIREEWLLPGRVPVNAQPQYDQAEGVQVFASLYHAVRWWSTGTSTAFFHLLTRGQAGTFADRQEQDYARVQGEIRTWLPLVEAGRYPKHPGEHCNLCPVRGECLGL